MGNSVVIGAGGAGGTAILDFGTGSDIASVAVTGLSWVTASTVITPALRGDSSVRGIEEGLIEELKFSITNLIAGTGFTIVGYAPHGALGKFTINWIGR